MGSLARHHLYVCVGIVYIRLILCHSIVSNAFSFYAPYIHAKITVSSDSIDLVNVWLSRERERRKNHGIFGSKWRWFACAVRMWIWMHTYSRSSRLLYNVRKLARFLSKIRADEIHKRKWGNKVKTHGFSTMTCWSGMEREEEENEDTCVSTVHIPHGRVYIYANVHMQWLQTNQFHICFLSKKNVRRKSERETPQNATV